MKIICKNEQQLLNVELPPLLAIPGHLEKTVKYQDFRTMNHTCLKYLSYPMVPIAGQSVERATELLRELNVQFPDKLVKLEQIMIVNSRPTSMVELCVLIEDCMQRFEKSELELILSLLDKYMPYQKPVDDEETE